MYNRVESPPPRLRSPDLQFAPLTFRRSRQPTPPIHATSNSADKRPLKPSMSTGRIRHQSTPSLRPNPLELRKSRPRTLLAAPPSPLSATTFRQPRRRSGSPPPSPAIKSAPPPLPPIPQFALGPGDKRAVLHTTSSARRDSSTLSDRARRSLRKMASVPDGRSLLLSSRSGQASSLLST